MSPPPTVFERLWANFVRKVALSQEGATGTLLNIPAPLSYMPVLAGFYDTMGPTVSRRGLFGQARN